MSEPPRSTFWQELFVGTAILLIMFLWLGLVTALTVTMILRDASGLSPDQNESPDFYYDSSVWESPVH